jgi:signal transduction histidine kinase
MPSEPVSDLDAQSALDALPDGVVIAGPDAVVTRVNARARELIGPRARPGVGLGEALPLQDLNGCRWWDTLRPYDGLATRTGLVEGSWLLADGTELLVSGRIDRDGPCGPVRHVAVTLRTARARARLEKERADLITTMAHELRSPLTGVKGFTAALLDRWEAFDDDQKKVILQSVHHDTDRLARLVSDLLEVARISAGRLPLAASATDPTTCARSVARSVAAGTDRSVEVRADGGDLRVHADPDRLAQVLTNVLENAIRHGQGAVTVTVGPYDEDAVLVAVEDEGRGIAPDQRSRVFTKHWRSGTRGGTGLGMYIAHGLVTAHGGSIEVGDAASGGARVEIVWPRALDLH